MDSTLEDFLRVLRATGMPVSVAESIDAHTAVRAVGLRERALLKGALGATLAKSAEDRRLFDESFERFFGFTEPVNDPEGTTEEDAAPTSAQGSGAGAGGGGGQAPQLEDDAPQNLSEQLLRGEWEQLDARISAAGQRQGLNRIAAFTQRGRFTRAISEDLGIAEVERDIARLSEGDSQAQETAARLDTARGTLLQRIGAHVDRHIELFADPEFRQQLQGRLAERKLGQIDPAYYREMSELVRRMAKQLISRHARRRKAANRGQLDFRRTLRAGLAYDGVPFNTHWRRIKKSKPSILVLCDVSGSVAAASRFLLMFLYSVSSELPKIRSFAFSDSLLEVTELFQQHSLEEAVGETVRRMGERSSDYGNTLREFEHECLADIDHRTTVIVLGDARSNHGDPGLSSLRNVYRRARQVIWLNPESRVQWGTGDSEMPRLATACHRVRETNTLKHLERLVEELMRA